MRSLHWCSRQAGPIPCSTKFPLLAGASIVCGNLSCIANPMGLRVIERSSFPVSFDLPISFCCKSSHLRVVVIWRRFSMGFRPSLSPSGARDGMAGVGRASYTPRPARASWLVPFCLVFHMHRQTSLDWYLMKDLYPPLRLHHYSAQAEPKIQISIINLFQRYASDVYGMMRRCDISVSICRAVVLPSCMAGM